MKKKYILSKLLFISLISSTTPQTQAIPILDPGSPTDFISVLLPAQSGKALIAVAADKTVRVINTANGETSKIWRMSISPDSEGELFAADIAPDGQWLAIGGNIGPDKDGILVFDWQTGNIQKRFKANTNGVRSLAWSPDGKSLFSGGKDNLIRVFETDNFQEIAQLPGHTSQIRCISISPNGKKIASTALDEHIRLWERNAQGWKDAKCMVLEQHTAMVENVSFSSKGDYLLSSGEDGKVFRWTTEGVLEREIFSNHKSILDQYNQTRQVVFSPSGNYWAVAETIVKYQGTATQLVFQIRVFDKQGIQKHIFKSHKQTVFQIKFINENTLASTDGTNNLFVWNTDGTTNVSLPAQSGMVPDIAFADGLRADFAFTTDISNYRLNCAFDWANLNFAPDIGTRNPKRDHLKTELNGKRLTQADDYHLSTLTGAIISSEQTVKGHISRFTLTPDGNILVLFEKALTLYSQEGAVMQELKGVHSSNRGLAVSSDGQFAITGNLTSGLQQLWHLPSGQLCATLFVRATDKEWVCWSPEGWFAASPKGAKMLKWYNPVKADFFREAENQDDIRKKFNQRERLMQSILEKQNIAPSKPTIEAASAKPELILSTGHGTAIEEIAFSPKGDRIATAGDDNFLKVWDLKTGRLFTDILNADAPSVGGAKTVQFTKDGDRLLSVQSGGEAICLYDAVTGKQLRCIMAPLNMLAKARLSPDETLVVSTSNPRKAVGLWDIKPDVEKKIMDLPGVEDIADDAVFTPDGRQIIAVCRDRRVLFWDTQTRKLIKILSLTKPTNKREGMAFLELKISPNGRFFAVADGEAGTIWLGNCLDKTAQPLRQTTATQISSGIAFSPDSRYLAVAGIGMAFELIDINTQKSIQTLSEDIQAQNLTFSPDGRYIAVVSGLLHEFKIELWDISQNKAVIEFNRNIPLPKCVAISKSGRFFATGNTNNNVSLWDFKTTQYIYDLEGTPFKSHYDFGIQAIKFSPDEQLIAGASADGDVYLWETATGKLRHRFSGHTGLVTCLDFSPDGSKLLSGDLKRNVFLWDTSGKRLYAFPRHSAPVTAAAFSPDSKRAMYGNYDTLRVYDLTGKRLAVFNPALKSMIESGFVDSLRKSFRFGYININSNMEVQELWVRKIGASFSTDGQNILFSGGDDYQIGSYDLKTKKKSFLKKPNTVFTPVTAMAVSPDGKFIALCLRQSGNIDIFNAKTGELIRSVAAHKTTPFGVAFAQDGDRSLLATCADDGYAKLFDWKSSTEPLASFVADRDGHFTIVGKNNYFFNDRAGVTGISYKLNGEIYPFEQFDLRFNRPDYVLENVCLSPPQLIANYRNAWKKRLEKMGFRETDLSDDLHLPVVTLTNQKDLPLTTDKKSINLNIKATDDKYALDRILLSVNDVPVYGKKGLNIKKLNAKLWEKMLSVDLSQGKNKIQISVINNKAVESLRETFYIHRASPIATKPTLHIILLSASKYAQSNMNLQYPVKDARDFYRIFVEKQSSRYAKVVIDSFFNENLSRACLPKIKKRLLNTKVDDQVMILVGGHGLIGSDTSFYFGTWDIDFSKPQLRGIALEDLDQLLDSIPARQKIMFVDACNAGEIDKNNVRTDSTIKTPKVTVVFRSPQKLATISPKDVGLENVFNLMKELFIDLRQGSGATIIAGAGGYEFALEGDGWQNSVFMYSLLKGLLESSADLDKNGTIQVSELQNYLSESIYNLTQGRQRPAYRLENITNDFSVWETER